MQYFNIFAEDFELMKAKLSSDEIVDIMSALSELCLWGECSYTPQTPKQKYFWDKLKSKLDKDLSSYNASVENGKKGGRPKKETQDITQNKTQTKTQNITQDITQTKTNLEPRTLPPKNKFSDENIILSPQGKKQKNKIFQKPTIEEIDAYCQESQNYIDVGRFFDFYECKGWKVGKSPMKDWRAAVRNWARSSTSAPASRKTADEAAFVAEVEKRLAAFADNEGVSDV